MSKYRTAYAPEFLQQLVELVHAGRSVINVAHEFGPARRDSSQVDTPEPNGCASGNATV